MSEAPGLIWTIFFFLVALVPLIVVHELGHYLVGRWCGIKTDVFAVGFGRKLFSRVDKHGTEWRISWIPMGGYCRFAGDMSVSSEPNEEWLKLPQEERAKCFQGASLWKRAATVAAGPITNFLLAILIFAGFAIAFGRPVLPPVVQEVLKGAPAERSGILPGDVIKRIDGTEINDFTDIPPLVQDFPGETLDVVIERNGVEQSKSIVTATRIERDRFGNEYRLGQLGIAPNPKAGKMVPVSLLEAPFIATRDAWGWTVRMAKGLWHIITGRKPIKELGGPVKIARISGEIATLGPINFIHFLALMSINLGFMNLLPIPALDGGHLLFYALEAIKRGPVSPRVMEYAFRSGWALVLGFMAFVTLQDIASLSIWGKIAGLFG